MSELARRRILAAGSRGDIDMKIHAAKLFGAAVALGLLGLQPALAQSNCKEVKGNLSEVFFLGDSFNTGTITNAGWLTGTTRVDFIGPTLFPVPGIAVFAEKMTIATNQGQLKTNNVYLIDFGTLKASVIANIDPQASTGKFAGATGTLFLNVRNINIAGNPHRFESEVHGQVCFENQ
jgi:hypothetical protein